MSAVMQPTGELRSLIEKQEVYIGQLEKETKFCRDQLVKVLAQVQVPMENNFVAGVVYYDVIQNYPKQWGTNLYSGDLNSGLVQISKGQKEVGLTMVRVWILNGIMVKTLCV